MMALLQSIGFGTPLALLALAVLPLIWWLLRFTPPKPKPQAFPPIRILLGLPRQEETPDKTPWWLLLLRLVLAAIVIFVVAQPFLQPKGAGGLPGGQRLIIVDDGWAAAGRWSERRQALLDVLEDAQARGEPVVLAGTSPTATAREYEPMAARAALDQARVWTPSPFATDRMALVEKLKTGETARSKSIIWFSDGLDSGNAAAFAAALPALAPDAALRIFGPKIAELPLALGPVKLEGNEITLDVMKPPALAVSDANLSVKAVNGRTLLDVPVSFGGGSTVKARFSLPTALRNEIQSVGIADQQHAAARQLFDDRWRRRTIALQAAEASEQAQPLLSPLHYISRGLEPYAELFEPQTSADLSGLIDSGLSMLVLADVGVVPEDVSQKVSDWVDKGGVLLRFSGPRLAAGHDELIPVKLREGDRTLGSALSWETPQTLQEFPRTSPFAGLEIDPRITVTRQVLAEPDADLSSKTWANLADGTPLVTAEKRGKGLLVLFHVTANADWSNLPLSGLFVEMMQRVAGLDPAQQVVSGTSTETSSLSPRLVMTGEGDLVTPDGAAQAIAVADFEKTVVSAVHPPGLYAQGGKERALNHLMTPEILTPMESSLAGVAVASFEPQEKKSLVPLLALAALGLFLLDCLATVMIGGGLSRFKPAAALFLFALLAVPFDRAAAQSNEAQSFEMQAALSPRLAYVKTGDDEVDRISAEGLAGLTLVLSDRTSANLAEPYGLNIDSDDPVFYPVLYWPVLENAQTLSEATRAKIARYMQNGGTIFFDLRTGGVDSGESSDALRRVLDKLDVPPLEPVPENHVLTRSFYLLQSFPGRYEGGPLWVESTLDGVTSDPGTSDGVSAIIIGTNDYAAAWALDDRGQPLYAVVPGSDRQREYAFRTGINVVMYALTGNYKADQVHVPALLERLGQ